MRNFLSKSGIPGIDVYVSGIRESQEKAFPGKLFQGLQTLGGMQQTAMRLHKIAYRAVGD